MRVQRWWFLVAVLLATPRDSRAQSERPLWPLLIEAERADIVLLDSVGAQLASSESAMAELVLACRKVTLVRPADSARVVRARLLGAASPRDPSTRTATVVVTPRSGPRLDCLAPVLQNHLAAARGVHLTRDTVRAPGTTIRSIALLRSGEVQPGTAVVGSATRLTPLGAFTEAGGVAYVTVPLEVFAPDASGVPRDIAVEIVVDGTEGSRRIPIPPGAVLELWDRTLAERARVAASRTADPELQASHLPVPRDSALRAARELYDRQENAAAYESALHRLEAGALRRADRLSGRMQLAFMALAHADTLAARVHFQHAVQAEPCVALGADAPAAARTLLADIRRPPGACAPVPLHRAALRGLLRPGAGHPASGRSRILEFAAVGAIGLAFVGGWQADLQATERYEAYLRFTPPGSDQVAGADAAAQAFDRAVAAQRASKGLLWLAGIAWGAAIVDGVISELNRRDEVRALGHYGSAPPSASARRAGIAVIAPPGRVGFALRFF